MKIGAEDRKKLVLLGILGAAALYLVYSNLFSGPSVPSGSASAPAARIAPSAVRDQAAAPPRAPSRTRNEDWHPVYIAKRAEDRVDPAAVDPTLRLDLLARLQAVPAAGSGRNLFSMSAAPAQLPDHKEPVVQVASRPMGPPPIPPPPGPPGPPPMPPVTFKYYGIATVRADGSQTAFFLEGESILIKSVGDTVAGSYRLVRIGQNSAIVEDVKSKRQQTVPLAQEAEAG